MLHFRKNSFKSSESSSKAHGNVKSVQLSRTESCVSLSKTRRTPSTTSENTIDRKENGTKRSKFSVVCIILLASGQEVR